jgi:tetratricopeptide (TPR) repeat protein
MQILDYDQRHLECAKGYLELGMLEDARDELEQITSPHKADPEVIQVRLALSIRSQNWDMAVLLSRYLSLVQTENANWIVLHAYATRRAKGTWPALEILREAENRFPKDVLIKLNLGCYAAQLGNFDEARKYVKAAIDLDPSGEVFIHRKEFLEWQFEWLFVPKSETPQ